MVTQAQAILNEHMTEDECQAIIVGYAKALGYISYHIPDSRMASCAGYPDLMLCREENNKIGLLYGKAMPRIIVIEVKKQTGRVSPMQHVWLNTFRACGIETHVLRPSDLDGVEAMLKAS